MPDVVDHDLIVLGGGPGGYAAAFLAADKGMKVTLINEMPKPGGTCLHVGCIPSKALLHAAKLITDARDAARFGIHFEPPRIAIDEVRSHWQQVVGKLASNLSGLCKTRNVNYLAGRAQFVDPETLELADGSRHRFQNCIIATGSVPARPQAIALQDPRVMTSTEALQLQGVPGSLLVIGGGYIGLELGYVYAALGCSVTVVEMTPNLLPGADRDLVVPLQKRLTRLFKNIYLNTTVLKLESTDAGIRAHLQGPDLAEPSPMFDRVLIAVGRTPSSRNLGLELAGVRTRERGFIVVNEQCQTSQDHIYAIGDVAGEPMLAHKAAYEGKVAVEVIAGEKVKIDYQAIPAVVFTDPELAWCGLTQTEAESRGLEVEIARFPWAASGRAETLGRTEGLTKLILDKASDRVLGIGICGKDAGEMISEGVLAIEMGATARDLALTIHPHPTLSETLFEGAEVAHGMSTHLPPRRKKERVSQQ